jgi:hypothetical protein
MEHCIWAASTIRGGGKPPEEHRSILQNDILLVKYAMHRDGAYPRFVCSEWLKSLIEGFRDHNGLEDFICLELFFARSL